MDWFLEWVRTVIVWTQQLLPEWVWAPSDQEVLGFYKFGVDGMITSSWTGGSWIRQAARWAAGWNDILPVTEAAAIVSLVISVYGVLLAMRSGKWIIGVIRGSGTT